MNTELLQVTTDHIHQMMTWFENEKQLNQWSGPGFAYPYDFDSFKRDLKLDKIQSFSLQSGESELLAFGQYYRRLERCHLGRLVVNPLCRGQGVVDALIDKMMEKGCFKLSVKQCSLFVLSDNHSAIKAYKKAGFVVTDYPDQIPLANCLYMVHRRIQ